MKKRYSKKKKVELKKKSTSGAGLDDVEEAKKKFKEYDFFAWIEEHLQLRETKTNLRPDDHESSTDQSDNDDIRSFDTETDLASSRKKMRPTPGCSNISADKAKLSSSSSKKVQQGVQQAEIFALQSIGNAFAAKTQSGSSGDKKDADDLFGGMIAQELKEFSGRKKALLKHRIQSLIYEFQIESSELPNTNFMPRSPVASQPNTNFYGSPVYENRNQGNANFGYYSNLLNG